MESAIGIWVVILGSVCASVLASVGAVAFLEKRKKNGVRKEEVEEEGGNGNIIILEKLATRIIERERERKQVHGI